LPGLGTEPQQRMLLVSRGGRSSQTQPAGGIEGRGLAEDPGDSQAPTKQLSPPHQESEVALTSGVSC
jgi:hypothetical protein